MKILLVLLFCLITTTVQAQQPKHGSVNENSEAKLQVWNGDGNEWNDIESFWISFAKSNQTKFWGQTATYPKTMMLKNLIRFSFN